MKFFFRIVFLLYFQFFGVTVSYSQDCKELLKVYFNTVNNIKRPENKSVYFFEIKTKYYYWDEKTASREINSKIYLSSDMYVFETDMYSLYSDKMYLYYVDHTMSQIRKYRVAEESKMKDELIGIFSESQNQLFEKGVFSNCSERVYNNQKVKHVIVYSTTELLEKYNLQQVEYFINPESNKIVKAVIYYSKDYRFKRLEVEYVTFNINYKNWKFKKASDLVFDKNGLPYPKFKNYSLIDKEE